jgi:hypothetical protein
LHLTGAGNKPPFPLRARPLPFQFENLLVYQKALDFADEACQLTSQFDRGYGFPADQLNRAARSISRDIGQDDSNGGFG